MDIFVRFDPEARDANGNLSEVYLIAQLQDGTRKLLHATISTECRELATELYAADVENGNKLKSLRMERGMSQKALADAAGTSQSQLSHWEAGKYRPNLRNAMRLARALGISIADLGIDFFGDPLEGPPSEPPAQPEAAAS